MCAHYCFLLHVNDTIIQTSYNRIFSIWPMEMCVKEWKTAVENIFKFKVFQWFTYRIRTELVKRHTQWRWNFFPSTGIKFGQHLGQPTDLWILFVVRLNKCLPWNMTIWAIYVCAKESSLVQSRKENTCACSRHCIQMLHIRCIWYEISSYQLFWFFFSFDEGKLHRIQYRVQQNK